MRALVSLLMCARWHKSLLRRRSMLPCRRSRSLQTRRRALTRNCSHRLRYTVLLYLPFGFFVHSLPFWLLSIGIPIFICLFTFHVSYRLFSSLYLLSFNLSQSYLSFLCLEFRIAFIHCTSLPLNFWKRPCRPTWNIYFISYSVLFSQSFRLIIYFSLM